MLKGMDYRFMTSASAPSSFHFKYANWGISIDRDASLHCCISMSTIIYISSLIFWYFSKLQLWPKIEKLSIVSIASFEDIDCSERATLMRVINLEIL
jgi:hypothetical protein